MHLLTRGQSHAQQCRLRAVQASAETQGAEETRPGEKRSKIDGEKPSLGLRQAFCRFSTTDEAANQRPTRQQLHVNYFYIPFQCPIPVFTGYA